MAVKINEETCIGCGACIDTCPVDCIVAGVAEDGYPMMYIDPETCIDCGACIDSCPVGSITE